MTSFKVLSTTWLQRKIKMQRSPRTLDAMTRTLHNDLWPALGHLEVTTISQLDCLHCIQTIEQRGCLAYAKRTRGWLRDILGLGCVLGMLPYNPAQDLGRIALAPPRATPYAHLDEAHLGAFLRALRQDDRHSPSVRTALWCCLTTAQRPNSVLRARWEHIDLSKALWSIPAADMKGPEPLVCPLSPSLIAMLDTLKTQRPDNPFVFAGRSPHQPLCRQSLTQAIDSLGYQGRFTPHGARHQFSTIAHEHGWPAAWIEKQLGHIVQGSEGHYNKASYTGARRVLLTWYSDYLACLEAGGPTSTERDAFIQRVKAARNTDVAEHVRWSTPGTTVEPQQDAPPTAGRRRTFAPWRK